MAVSSAWQSTPTFVSMPAGAVALLVLLSVQSYKASSRFINKRKSRKHGYVDLPTDNLGRPVNEHGKRLSKNEAKALAAHNQEVQRIRTAEREWRAKGEQLPLYKQWNDDAVILPHATRPNTAPAAPTDSATSTTHVVPDTAQSEANTSATARTRSLSTAALPDQPLPSGAFTVRRHTQTALPSISMNDSVNQPEFQDVFQHDGMDWRRATWESPPIYREDASNAVTRL